MAIEAIDEKRNLWLTTIDNPFNPYDQWDEWYAYDTSHGYNTCGLIARFINTNPEMTRNKYDLELERTLNKILDHLDPLGIYIKI